MSRWTGPDRDHDSWEPRANEHQPMNYRPTQEPGIFHVSRDSRHSDGIRLTEIDSPQWQGPLTESDNEAWGGQRPASSYEEWVKEDKETEAGS